MSDLDLPEPPLNYKWVVRENFWSEEFLDMVFLMYHWRPMYVSLRHKASDEALGGSSAFNTPQSIRNAALRVERQYNKSVKRKQYVGTYSRKDGQ